MKNRINSISNKLILSVGLILMLIFLFNLVTSESELPGPTGENSIYLTSDEPTQNYVGVNSYIIELISASKGSAIIKVTDANGKAETKSMNEGETVLINNLNIELLNADENNFQLSALLAVRSEETPIPEEPFFPTGEMTQVLTSDEPKIEVTPWGDTDKYIIELVSASNGDATLKVTNPYGGSKTILIAENKEKEVFDIKIRILNTEATNSKLTVHFGATAERIEINNGRKSITLTSEDPRRRILIKDEDINNRIFATIELMSASDGEATIKVKNDNNGVIITKTINEDGAEVINGMSIKLINAEETNLKLSATLSIEKAEDEDDKNISKFNFRLTNEKPIIGVDSVNGVNIIELISASDNDATIRVINEQGNSDTKTIAEGKYEAIKGIGIEVINADESNLGLSVDIVVSHVLSPVDLEEIKPNDETGPVNIPEAKKESTFCNGCELDNKCYPFSYRKSGQYCSDNYNFTVQLESSQKCENNFECSSNVCVSGQCVSEGLINKVLNWFKGLFGFS